MILNRAMTIYPRRSSHGTRHWVCQTSKSTKRKPQSQTVAVASTAPRAYNYKTFKKSFDCVYNDRFKTRKIDDEAAKTVTSQVISVEDFKKLSINRQLARYVSLIDGKIGFDELPKAPHGELARVLSMTLSGTFNEGVIGSVLVGCSDDRMISFSSLLIL
jgi:hypothetical protein